VQRRSTRGEIWAKSYFGAGLVQFSESAYSWSILTGILIPSMALAFTITFKQLIVSVGIQASTAKVQATEPTKAARNSHDRYQLVGKLQARVGTVIRPKFSLVELAIKRAWRVQRS